MELGAIVGSLRTAPSRDCYGVDHDWKRWMEDLGGLLDRQERAGDDDPPTCQAQAPPRREAAAAAADPPASTGCCCCATVFQRAALHSDQIQAYRLYLAARDLELRSSGLEPTTAAEAVARGRLNDHHLHLVGVDGPAKRLLRWLTAAADDDKRSLQVMAVVGPAGVGKTTLAMELNRRLRREAGAYFECLAVAGFSRKLPMNQVNAFPLGLANLQSITEVVIYYSERCGNSSSTKMTVDAVRQQVARHPDSLINLVINGKQEDIEASGEA
uniref:NB-ARC domain-containing protein n=1 Tax=Oryza punctata TaxID=4537 RepID=A0A0E0MH32_ORYPU